jgi:hypothetical protein
VILKRYSIRGEHYNLVLQNNGTGDHQELFDDPPNLRNNNKNGPIRKQKKRHAVAFPCPAQEIYTDLWLAFSGIDRKIAPVAV